MRLDSYLAKHHPEHSRATWQKFIKFGYVTVDGATEENVARAVDSSNFIKFDLPATPDFADQKLPIIYEDDNVLVINKPAGVLTHSKGALSDEFTVADFIKTQAGKTSDLPDNNRFGIVHRLDRGTSGVIIGAKNAASLKYLQKQFSDHKVKKTYLAVVGKVPKQFDEKETEDGFRIDLPIGRNPKKPATFRVDPKGKPAVTDVRLLQTFPDGTALLELKPQTGRTHQLRVHLAYIGAPIVGDVVYGDGAKAAERMLLHARELEITIPAGQRKTFTAECQK
ncbi:MAG: RluA family pseudouridine synthase [Candidatus Nomurabacteria bacterium]|jgi:23S rRNA pseudouridine1911/1915/1917 synthase|nr:RluA family pseudouridine synthase [Candidatus Nomurabacteria bacterium]